MQIWAAFKHACRFSSFHHIWSNKLIPSLDYVPVDYANFTSKRDAMDPESLTYSSHHKTPTLWNHICHECGPDGQHLASPSLCWPPRHNVMNSRYLPTPWPFPLPVNVNSLLRLAVLEGGQISLKATPSTRPGCSVTNLHIQRGPHLSLARLITACGGQQVSL